MTLPASGNSISLSQVNTELGRSSTANISLGESAVRSLFGVASGQISMSDGFGKSATVTLTGATLDTSSVYDSTVRNVLGTTGPVNAFPSPSNASGPLTYAWQYVSGSTFNVDNPVLSSTTFSYTPVTNVGSRTGYYRCAITQGSTTVYSSNVTVTIDWA